MKAMNEALESVNKIYDLLSKPCIVIEEVRQACQKARAVLISTPRRNCDVGTADEQAKRMDAYCASYGERIGCGWRCDNCPLCSIDRCELVWAQMPYEEGESK